MSPKLSRKAACVVPANFNRTQIPTLCCTDGSHGHLTSAQLREYRDFGLIETVDRTFGPEIEWLREPERHVRGVVRMRRQFPIRGLSCKVGSGLAIALATGGASAFNPEARSKVRQSWPELMMTQLDAHIAPHGKTRMPRQTNSIRSIAPGPVTIIEARGTPVESPA